MPHAKHSGFIIHKRRHKRTVYIQRSLPILEKTRIGFKNVPKTRIKPRTPKIVDRNHGFISFPLGEAHAETRVLKFSFQQKKDRHNTRLISWNTNRSNRKHRIPYNGCLRGSVNPRRLILIHL